MNIYYSLSLHPFIYSYSKICLHLQLPFFINIINLDLICCFILYELLLLLF